MLAEVIRIPRERVIKQVFAMAADIFTSHHKHSLETKRLEQVRRYGIDVDSMDSGDFVRDPKVRFSND